MAKLCLLLLFLPLLTFVPNKGKKFNFREYEALNKGKVAVQPINRSVDLIVVSDVHCSFCNDALPLLKRMLRFEVVNVVFFEYGAKNRILNERKDYLTRFVFIEAQKYPVFGDDYFPMFYLCLNGEIISSQEGLDKESSGMLKNIEFFGRFLNKNGNQITT